MKVRVNQNLFNSKVTGLGEAVLCLSGFGCDHYNFEGLDFESHMVRLDNRGMGASENNLDEYPLELLAIDAHEFMRALGFESYHVVGISMGGIIAQECALRYPDSIRSLTLMCTTSGGLEYKALPSLEESDLRAFYSLPPEKSARIAVNATTSNESKREEIINLRLEHPAKLEEVIKQKRAVDAYLKQAKDLSYIKCPTLIMTGANDRYVDPINSKILKDKIPHSWLVVIEETDHLFFLEKPEVVSAYVTQFLTGEVCYDLTQ